MAHEEVSKMLSKQHFQLALVQELQDSSLVVTPDVFTIDDTGIERVFISWETTLLTNSSVFLPSTKSRPIPSTGKFTKIIVDITNITKVSLNQDFKTFFISQEFVVEIQEERAFSSAVKSLTRAGSSSWIRVAPSSANFAKTLGKLPQSCLQSLLLSHRPQSQIIEGK